jgi:6-phosphogluconolactonase
VAADARAAAQRAAELIGEAAREAARERGSFTLALSGGQTPRQMLAILAGLDLPWDESSIFQADERIAAPGSQERNLTHQIIALPLERQALLRPMPVTSRDLDAAAAEYEATLPERLDIAHLGLGRDGHTASLVPGDPVLEVRDRRVAVTEPYEGHRRMTLTYPALDRARQVLWLVTGEEKREAVSRLLAGDKSIPAARVAAGEQVLVADEAAAG